MQISNIEVIIPLYNKAAQLERCLSSVFNQTHKPSRVIIVDDGSTDDSLKILSGLLKSSIAGNIAVEVIHQRNRGVSAARNKGLESAKEDLVAFLDADDFWDESFLKEMSEFMAVHPDCVYWSCGHKDCANGAVIRHYNFKRIPDKVTNYSYYAIDYPIVNSSKVIIRREVILSINGFPETAKVAEDLYVWILLSLNGCLGFNKKELVFIDKTPSPHRIVRTSTIVPYPVMAFSSNDTLKSQLTHSIKRFIFIICLKHGLVAKAHQDGRVLSKCIGFMRKISPVYSVVLCALNLIPAFLIRKGYQFYKK